MRQAVFSELCLTEPLLSLLHNVRVGKKSKNRVTVAFFVNAAGGKEPPIVVGKSKSPRCFSGLKDKQKPHGVSYYANNKAWMNTEIKDDILASLNRKLEREDHHILLLLDNAPCHPRDYQNDSAFSNIKVVFLPVNTTSRLQPLVAGVIQSFKCQYRALLIKHTLGKIDSSANLSAFDIAKSVDILTAIRMIKLAWRNVKEETIIKCFKNCGAIAGEEDPLSDPFADIEELMSWSIRSIQQCLQMSIYRLRKTCQHMPLCLKGPPWKICGYSCMKKPSVESYHQLVTKLRWRTIVMMKMQEVTWRLQKQLFTPSTRLMKPLESCMTCSIS